MITINGNEVSTDKWMKRKVNGGDSYFKKCSLLPNETAEDFEEVDELPKEEIPENLKMLENNV